MDSIILTIHNKEFLTKRIISAIGDLTVGDYELIIVFDGCSDNSERYALESLSKLPSINHKILHTPDVFETKANNIGMKASQGDYIIIVQDDMVVNEHGWNKRVTKPIKEFDDVYACSAFCAHNIEIKDDTISHTDFYYARLADSRRDVFAIRDIAPRGPLAMRHDVVEKVAYLDEDFCPGMLDDHDLHARVFKRLGLLCGSYKTEYISKFEWGSSHPWHWRGKDTPYKEWVYKAEEKNSITMKERHMDFICMEKHNEDRHLS